MKKLLGIIVLGLLLHTQSLAMELNMIFKTHLKCEMFNEKYFWLNPLIPMTDEPVKGRDPKYISFDKNFVFYSWNKKQKTYELKDKITQFDELRIRTEGHTNFDDYVNIKEWRLDPNLKLIENPGSYVFFIDREKGQLEEYEIYSGGSGNIYKYKCKKIYYFSLPKEPKEKVNTKF